MKVRHGEENEENVSMLERTSYKLYPIIKECARRLVKIKNHKLSEIEETD